MINKKLTKMMYILQKGIKNYFKEIGLNQEVIMVNNPCEGMIFDSLEVAEKFQAVLTKDYGYTFVLIPF